MVDTHDDTVAARRDDVVASIARQAPPLSDAARARLALLLKPTAVAR